MAPESGAGRRSGVELDVAVLDLDDDVVAPGEVAADAVGDGDRAVAAAGAADAIVRWLLPSAT